MSQDQAEYNSGGEPAAIIERPRNVLAVKDDGLVDYKVWGWVKMSARFRSHIKKMRGAKLAVWLCLALSIDEQGEFASTVKELEEMTGYSHTEVLSSISELEKMGYLSVNRGGRKYVYLPNFVARGENNPVESQVSLVKKVESTPQYQVESSPSIEKMHSSIKELKELTQPLSIENAIATGRPVTQDMVQTEQHNAPREFERAFGFGELPWDSTQTWQKFKKFVVSVYQSTPRAFTEYVQWREGDGKYRAFSNKKIRETPAAFMDTGWPEFLTRNISTRYNREQKPGRSIPQTLERDL